MKILTRLTIIDEEIHQYEKNTTDESLIWTLKFISLPFWPENKPPFIMPGTIPAGIQRLKVNETFRLYISGDKISLDTISLEINYENKLLTEIMTYNIDPTSLSTSIEFAPTKPEHLGLW
jgi:hypothetical protein